jgi:magnesium transporter
MKHPKKKQQILEAKVGKPPGTLVYTGEKTVEEVRVTLTVYDKDGFEVMEFDDGKKALEKLHPDKVNWINFKGIGNVKKVEELGRALGFHSLILEDILHVGQLPKIDMYDEHIFTTLKILSYNRDMAGLGVEHVGVVLGKNYVVSFCDTPQDIFKPISDRIASPTTKVKARKADYLLYYLVDFIVDQYYFVSEAMNEEVDHLEDILYEDFSEELPKKIIHLKKKHTELKRYIRPLADALRSLRKAESSMIEDYVTEYFNDVLDHLIQFEESITSRQETLGGMMDIYMSTLSNRMNKVMYTLTIVAAIFIPLTFLAGIYGMNFTNMPELQYEYGYFILLGVMLLLGIGLYVYMKRKRWF